MGQADSAFYSWDNRRVHCAIDIDTYALISQDSINTGLDRAADRGEVLELYNHDPGKSIQLDAIEGVLAGAVQRGLPFLTYSDLTNGIAPTAGLLYSFDDAFIGDWMAARPLFQKYNARLTFFIAYYNKLSDADKASIQQLAADGHDIQAHSVRHTRGPDYVDEYGLDAYMNDEIAPSIDELRTDGYNVSTFAYPYGARTDETDRAILDHVQLLRSVSYTWDSPAIAPCPI